MEISLYSVERGSGEPLVLLHGNGEDSSYFRHQLDYFSKNYRVIAVDTRGHGKSPRGTEPFCFDTFARDLRDFLDEKSLRDIHLLGFSDGANTALTFALRHPEYLRTLVLNGADLHPSGVKRSVQIPIVLGYWAVSAISAVDQRAVPKRELLGLMVKEPNIPPETLVAIQTPTLVIAGTRDMILESHTRLIQRHIPNSRLCFVEGDHFIAAKASDAFNLAVDEFLKDCRRKGTRGPL